MSDGPVCVSPLNQVMPPVQVELVWPVHFSKITDSEGKMVEVVAFGFHVDRPGYVQLTMADGTKAWVKWIPTPEDAGLQPQPEAGP